MFYIIYQTAFIGDIILATSMVKTLSNIDPAARIVFVTTPAGKNILENNDRIEKIVVYDKKSGDRGLSGILRIAAAIKEIVKGEESAYISPHRFLRASIIGRLLNSGMRAGFKASSLSFLYNRRVPYRFGIHEIERNFELLKAIFADDASNEKPARPELFPSDADYSRVKETIFSSIDTGGKLVAIAPGSIWPTKRWHEDYFEMLIQLLKNQGIKVILIGGKEDLQLCARLSPDSAINLAGKFSILESAAAISLADAIVTNDSAPLHIASAMNIPTIAIFGATTPHLGFSPLAEKSIVLENKDAECRPCGRHGGRKCGRKHFDCMMKIYPEMVLDELVKVI